MTPASVSDYRELARKRLPRMFFDYIDGGSFTETTLRRNISDFQEVVLRQRVMRGMSDVRTSIETLGERMSMPIGLSPVGLAGLYSRRGELQAARAANAAGIPACLSTLSICSIEEVAAAARPPWFQLYMLTDRGYMRELLARAADAICPVLVFTVDMPTTGGRYRDYRTTGIVAPAGVERTLERLRQGISRPHWSWNVFARGRPHIPGNIAAALPAGSTPDDALLWVAANMERSVTWKDLDFVRQHWSGPIVIKGVLDPDDARDAVQAGAQGLTISNHGGRQLDGVRSSISALPRIADAIGDAAELYLDGGVRSGLDVLKAMALGARACFIGRPWVWALAAGGEPMVERLLGTLRSELSIAMILSGCSDVADANNSVVDSG